MLKVKDIINENIIDDYIVKTWKFDGGYNFEIVAEYSDDCDIPDEVCDFEVTAIYGGHNRTVVIEAEVG